MNQAIINVKKKLINFFLSPENRTVFIMFFPVLIEQLIINMMGTVHTIMLANISKQAISAISLVDQLNQFAYAILNSVSIGATIIVSQYIGSKKILAAKSTAEQAITVGFIISIFTALIFIFLGDNIFVLFFKIDTVEPAVYTYAMTYIKSTAISFPLLSFCTTISGIVRGTGDSKSPIIVSIVMGAVNIIAALIFIFGFHLEVLGAGLAIILSRIIGAVFALRLILRKQYLRKFSNLLKLRFTYIKQILRIGMYSGAENMIFQTGRTITQGFFIASGTLHITANGIASSLFNILASPGNSMSTVATTVVGRYMGAKEKKQAYAALRNIVIISMFLLFVIHAIFMPFAPMVIKLYTKEAEIISLIMRLFWLNFIFMPTVWPASFTLFSGMKGAGDVKYTTFISILSMWIVRVLFGYILGYKMQMGVTGVWLAMFLDWAFRAVFAVIRFLRKKWLEKSVL